jgi:hypothetical protein
LVFLLTVPSSVIIVDNYITVLGSQDSVVCMATGWTTRDRGLSPDRDKNFLLFMSSRTATGSTQPPIQWVPGVKRPGREAEHSPRNSTEVKKIWICTPIPPYNFMA